MKRPNLLLLGANEALASDLGTALKDSCRMFPVDAPAHLMADEYRRRQAGALLVVLDPTLEATDASQRFTAIATVAAAGGIVIVVSPNKDPELILQAMRA